MKTGFEWLDVRIRELNPGDITVIGSFSGVGTTNFLLKSLSYGQKNNLNGIFFFRDMNYKNIHRRYASIFSGTPYSVRGEYDELILTYMSNYPSISMFKRVFYLDDIKSYINLFVKKQKLDYIIIDDLFTLIDVNSPTKNSDIYYEIISYLKTLDIPVILGTKLIKPINKKDKFKVNNTLHQIVTNFLVLENFDSSNILKTCKIIKARYRSNEDKLSDNVELILDLQNGTIG